MKRFIGLLTAVTLIVLCAAPALAAGLSISPPTVEFDVPADGSATVEFLVYEFTGDLEISLENIPLRVEPTTVSVTAEEAGTKVVLTFYGDESLGSKIYQGKIRFLAMTGGTVAFGIKVRATVNHMASGEPLREEAPEETLLAEESLAEESPPEEETAPAAEQASSEEIPATIEKAPTAESPAPEQPPTPSQSSFPVLPVVGIAAGAVIIIALIIVVVRRRQY